MTIAQRIDRDIDAFYDRKRRERYRCCLEDIERQRLEMGMRRFALETERTCRTCGTRFTRQTSTGSLRIIEAA